MNKIYQVTFIEYTNSMKNYVKTENDDYLDVNEPFLIKECDIENIKKYGKGIRELIFVGTLKELS